jgi:hypothetical protein
VDTDLARRVLAFARSIAPGVTDLDGEPRLDAIAILKSVAAEFPAPGSRRVRSQSRNGTSISFGDAGSAFTSEDVAALRTLVGSAPAGLPRGSFPAGGHISRVWPEGEYS